LGPDEATVALSRTAAKRARDFFMSTPRRESVAHRFNLVAARVQTLTSESLQQSNCLSQHEVHPATLHN
jgi:hypothetical protein